MADYITRKQQKTRHTNKKTCDQHGIKFIDTSDNIERTLTEYIKQTYGE